MQPAPDAVVRTTCSQSAASFSPITGESGFIGNPDQEIFSVVHYREDEHRGDVLICPSWGEEFNANYRQEVLLARALAAKGMCVQRFHYRGVGHSSDCEVTFKSMYEDAMTALQNLRERSHLGETAVIGTRIGGVIAAALAAHTLGPLVLLGPRHQPIRFLTEQVLVARVWGMMFRDRGKLPRFSFEELNAEGSSDLMGHCLSKRLFDSIRRSDFMKLLQTVEGPVLLLDAAEGSSPPQKLLQLAGVLREADICVSIDHFPRPREWWSLTQDQPGVELVVQSVTRWLRATFT